CLLARTSSIKSAFLFLCFPGFREEPFFCPITVKTVVLLTVQFGALKMGQAFVKRFKLSFFLAA
ncbi:hypothetical protein CJF34_17210, partial [Pseudomonas lundensis]